MSLSANLSCLDLCHLFLYLPVYHPSTHPSSTYSAIRHLGSYLFFSLYGSIYLPPYLCNVIQPSMIHLSIRLFSYPYLSIYLLCIICLSYWFRFSGKSWLVHCQDADRIAERLPVEFLFPASAFFQAVEGLLTHIQGPSLEEFTVFRLLFPVALCWVFFLFVIMSFFFLSGSVCFLL